MKTFAVFPENLRQDGSVPRGKTHEFRHLRAIRADFRFVLGKGFGLAHISLTSRRGRASSWGRLGPALIRNLRSDAEQVGLFHGDAIRIRHPKSVIQECEEPESGAAFLIGAENTFELQEILL